MTHIWYILQSLLHLIYILYQTLQVSYLLLVVLHCLCHIWIRFIPAQILIKGLNISLCKHLVSLQLLFWEHLLKCLLWVDNDVNILLDLLFDFCLRHPSEKFHICFLLFKTHLLNKQLLQLFDVCLQDLLNLRVKFCLKSGFGHGELNLKDFLVVISDSVLTNSLVWGFVLLVLFDWGSLWLFLRGVWFWGVLLRWVHRHVFLLCLFKVVKIFLGVQISEVNSLELLSVLILWVLSPALRSIIDIININSLANLYSVYKHRISSVWVLEASPPVILGQHKRSIHNLFIQITENWHVLKKMGVLTDASSFKVLLRVESEAKDFKRGRSIEFENKGVRASFEVDIRFLVVKLEVFCFVFKQNFESRIGCFSCDNILAFDKLTKVLILVKS